VRLFVITNSLLLGSFNFSNTWSENGQVEHFCSACATWQEYFCNPAPMIHTLTKWQNFTASLAVSVYLYSYCIIFLVDLVCAF
jgi:hypothetical protein